MHGSSRDTDDVRRDTGHKSDHGGGRTTCHDRVFLPDHKDGGTCGRLRPEDQGNETLRGVLLAIFYQGTFRRFFVLHDLSHIISGVGFGGNWDKSGKRH